MDSSLEIDVLEQGTSPFNAKERKDRNRSLKEKKRQSLQTIHWLKLNYCSCPDVCLPREIIYEHYLEFCSTEKIVPACKATFGKLIRNTFPNVTSKRLGARGHSKYHYNGIGIRQNSEYCQPTQNNRGITRFSSCMSNKIEMDIFLKMYRMHCQCIVDVTISENFEEIRLFLLHFWQGFPDHLAVIFKYSITLDLIQICDSVLYRTLTDIMIPSEVTDITERLLRGIQNIASHWKKWLECSLENMPTQLKQLKATQAETFTKTLKRYVTFLHLAQVARPVLSEYALKSLSEELNEIEENNLTIDWMLHTKDHIKYLFPTAEAGVRVIHSLQKLLKGEFFIEMLIEWLDDSVRKIIENKDALEKARCSILYWVYILSKISYWLTEKKSDNFITFHLFSSILQEYLMLAFEIQQAQDQEDMVYLKLEKHLKTPVKNSADYFKSATSCFLATAKKQANSRHKVKEKSCEFNNSTSQKIRAESRFKEDRGCVLFSRESESSWMINPPVSGLLSTDFIRNNGQYSDCRFQQPNKGFYTEGTL
ncbi:DNA-binding protein RFX6 [Nephila pilipes]|uniref:DNA-binding protein RFX6 n=1 Tax=Nephila pilipes TaxID=299642 RepID=A0A8X6PKH1_NEPPI|nr:DNA-binding protein RFX6 [Nephila pilipes]